ncbi:hypothetical protein [uncultured Shewanella sp.]|uniref:PKD domain-containing protein n=1 Tax=uncultured Shewanella sp. TaxID=173975 RepID=UPI0026034CC9|nr:hypothetical protein [uncultured Shewanella sp.]
MSSFKYLLLAGTLSLVACGGSSEKGDESLPSIPRCEQLSTLTNITTESDIEFLVESSYQIAQSGAIIARIANQDSAGFHFNWQQTSGPELILKSVSSPVLAIDPLETGSYTFSVTVNGKGLAAEQNIEVTVTGGLDNRLNVRSDHQVVQGGDVSYRVDRVDEQIPPELNWCIASGPDINLDISNIESPRFIAPDVGSDTISILRATANIAGSNSSSEVIALITHEQEIESQYFDKPVARTHAYRTDSPYAHQLQPCIYSNQLTTPCSIAQLPLIGQTDHHSEKEKIIDRLLVSHQWMGENFETFLNEMDPMSDFSLLLQSVTAIVISYDIRPSFYWVVTGAIYLDPNDLWLLAEERDVINEAPDHRAMFGNELNFIMPWRYVKDNQYVSYSTPREVRTARSLAEMSPELSSLLFHELAHANDFFPRSVHDSIQGGTLLDHYNRRTMAGELVSDKVSLQFPLYSDELKSLADVSFRGKAATAMQKAYSPADISHFFTGDSATDYYAYSTIREDTAMLLEEAMMSHRYGILRDVGITDKPDNPTAANIIVNWGQRGRIAEDSIQDRAVLVLNEMLPELDAKTLISELPEPIPMVQGSSWLENLTISPSSAASVKRGRLETKVPELRFSGDRHKRGQGLQAPMDMTP